MFQWSPVVRYQPAQEGYWEPVTSTINWCEEDYYATFYCAEIVNAFTNLLFLTLGIRGIQNCRRYGHDSVYVISFIGYILVGSGSFLFHSTLKYPMQLIDELSMIYTTCLMCYACFSFDTSRRWILATSLISLSAFITLYYHYLQDPRFHQIVYAILTVIVVFRNIYVMEVNLRPSLRAKWRKETQRSAVELKSDKELAEIALRDEQILRDMWWMIAVGLSVFLGGFGLWGVDRKYCSTLRSQRHKIGLPWGILLEGHGWWHLMTGTGAYFYIVWSIWLRHCLNGRQEEYELSWPSLFSIPDIVAKHFPHTPLVENSEHLKLLNGYAKKGR